MSKESVRKEIDGLMLSVVGFIIAAGITIFAKTMFMGEQLSRDNAGMTWPFTCWWLFFAACNAAYLMRGMKKGWAKGDPANGLLIFTGPLVYYTWTFMLVWKKYVRKEEISL